MKLELSVSVEANESTVRDHIAGYFAQIGYTSITSQPNLIYQRGSRLGSLMSFSPKGWKVNVSVQIVSSSAQATQVAVTFDIDTTGQLVTEGERKFWQNEIDGIERAIQTGDVDISANISKARLSFTQNLIVGAMIVGLVFVLAISMRSVFGSQIAFCIGGAGGLLLGLLAAQWWLKFKIGG